MVKETVGCLSDYCKSIAFGLSPLPECKIHSLSHFICPVQYYIFRAETYLLDKFKNIK